MMRRIAAFVVALAVSSPGLLAVDGDAAQVFELGKDIIRTTLKILEVRSGKDVQYQDEEARKSGMGS